MKTPRKPGRPKAESRGSTVCTWLRQQEHDRLVKLAKQTDQSVSSVTARLLRMMLR